MNFSLDSSKQKSRSHNEDFSFELETPRGHFFALLDFAEHDYANLNATLKSKLETIVGSFVSLSRFSAELFLGFMAKEINNFLHKLGEQSGGPELLASGALCLVSGNRLSYFLCGDVQINVINNGRLLPLFGAAAGTDAATTAGIERLGAHNREAQVNDVVQSFTLQDADLVLLTTQGFKSALSGRQLVDEIAKLGSTDPKVISAALMKSPAVAQDDRSLIVISGPYEKYVDPVLTDLSKAVASLESRMDAFAESNQVKTSAQQFEVLKDDLKSKAAKIDLLELDAKLTKLTEAMAHKANTAELVGLEQQVAKLGKADESAPAIVGRHESSDVSRASRTGLSLAAVVGLVLAAAVLGSLGGGWLQSRANRKPAEAWSVKNDGGHIILSRLDGEPTTVTLNSAAPASGYGEQRFSSFADAKRYIDTLTSQPANPPASAATTPAVTTTPAADAVTEITLKEGDSLKKLAAQYNVPQERLMTLNPTIKRWSVVRIGQKIVVPATTAPPVTTPATVVSAPPAAPGTPPADQVAIQTAPANTTEVVVGPGDSLNRLAARYKVTPQQLRELNPNITNWALITAGQKVLVPAQPGA